MKKKCVKGAVAYLRSSKYPLLHEYVVLGLIDAATKCEFVTGVFYVKGGIEGLANSWFWDETPGQKDDCCATGPKSYQLPTGKRSCKKILKTLKTHDIRYLFCSGGLKLMNAANEIDKYLKRVGYDCRIIGIPEAIDNSMLVGHQCLGYGGMAKGIIDDVAEKCSNKQNEVAIIEIVGKSNGWMTGAAAFNMLANNNSAPDLVYFEETDFSLYDFIKNIKQIYLKKGTCVAVVSKGIHYVDGGLVLKDAWSHGDSVAQYLARYLREYLNYDVPLFLYYLRPEIMERVTQMDHKKAYVLGAKAMQCAVAGNSGYAVGIYEYGGGELADSYPLREIIGRARKVPGEWIREPGAGITEEFYNYLYYVINGRAPRLKSPN